MISNAADNSSLPLLAVVQMLLSARGLDEVRAATAHGAEVISRYSTLSLYEALPDGSLELTTRSGDELGPGGEAVEDLLREKARASAGAVSTLDMPLSDDHRLIVREYTRRSSLCITRPLCAYGELTGVVVLHYTDRNALGSSKWLCSPLGH